MDEQTLDLPDDLNIDTHRSDEEDDDIDDELDADQLDPDKDGALSCAKSTVNCSLLTCFPFDLYRLARERRCRSG